MASESKVIESTMTTSDLKKEFKALIEEHEAAKKKLIEFKFRFGNASWKQMDHYLHATHMRPLSVRACDLSFEEESDDSDQALKGVELPFIEAETRQAQAEGDNENRAAEAKDGTQAAGADSTKSSTKESHLAPKISTSQLESVVDKLVDALGFVKVTTEKALSSTFKGGEIGVELVRDKSNGTLLQANLLSPARGRPTGSIDIIVAPAHTLGSISRLTQTLCGISVKTTEDFVENREQVQFEAALQCVALNQEQLVDDRASVFVVVTDFSQHFEVVSLTTNELGDRLVRYERFTDLRFGLSALRQMCVASEKVVSEEIGKLETITKESLKKEERDRKKKSGVADNPFKFASGHRESWIPEIIEEDDMLDLSSLLGGAQMEDSAPPPNMFN